ncbi:leucine-rich repeat protein [Tanacetum coccineum]
MGNIRCLFFIILILESILTNKCLGARYITAACSKKERLALIKFKNSVKDEFGMLSSWGVGNDCCRWERVTCDNATGSVIGLSLRGNVMGSVRDVVFVDDLDSWGVGEEHYSSKNDFSDYFAEKCYQLVGGKVNSCLAELRHLKYLDLSWNGFLGSHILEFIGSFEKLSYLNLANAGCGGIIPSHIGNLSNLKVLHVSS